LGANKTRVSQKKSAVEFGKLNRLIQELRLVRPLQSNPTNMQFEKISMIALKRQRDKKREGG
jgi:hypothetical protein